MRALGGSMGSASRFIILMPCPGSAVIAFAKPTVRFHLFPKQSVSPLARHIWSLVEAYAY